MGPRKRKRMLARSPRLRQLNEMTWYERASPRHGCRRPLGVLCQRRPKCTKIGPCLLIESEVEQIPNGFFRAIQCPAGRSLLIEKKILGRACSAVGRHRPPSAAYLFFIPGDCPKRSSHLHGERLIYKYAWSFRGKSYGGLLVTSYRP